MKRRTRETGWAFETLHQLQVRAEVVSSAEVPRLHEAATAETVAEVLEAAFDGEREEILGAILIDHEGRILGWTRAPVRLVEGVGVEVRALLQVALLTMSDGLVGFRWAPPGKGEVKKADRDLAARLIRGAGVLDLEVRDYLVVDGRGGWKSVRESWREWPDVVRLGLLWSERGGREMPVKYRDPVTQATWHGGGSRPKWLETRLVEGYELEDFEVKDQ